MSAQHRDAGPPNRLIANGWDGLPALLLERMSEGFALHEMVYAPDGRPLDYVIRDANPAYERHTGLACSVVRGRPASEVYGITPAPFLDAYARVAASGVSECFEALFEPLQRHFRVSVYSLGRGEFVTVFTDITEYKLTEQSLQEETTRRRILFEQSPDGILIVDAETTGFLEFNTAAHRQLGYSHEEFAQLRITDLDVCESAEDTRARIAGVFRDGSADFETVQRTRQGELRNVHVTAQIVDVQGRRLYHCIWRDITERKRAENALRETERKLRTLVENLPDLIVRIGRDCRYMYVNPAVTKAFGATADEFVGRIPGESSLPSQGVRHNKLAEMAIRVLEEGAGNTFDALLTTILGVRHYEVMHVPERDDDGDLVSVLGIAHDITERKQTEEALIASEKRLQLALRAGGLGVWDWDIAADTVTCYGNPTSLWEGGSEPTTLPRSAVDQLIYPEDTQLFDAAVEQALRDHAALRCEYRVRLADGTVHWVATYGEATYNEEGSPIRMVGIIQDVTERKDSEAQLRQAHKMESVGRLAGGVAHDFNNMLQVIIGHTDLALILDGLDSRIVAHLEQIRQAADHSASLTSQLLAFARKQTISPKTACLNDLVSQLEKILRRLIGEDVHLEWAPSPVLWNVRIDPSQVGQILTNLVVNARDAITESGTITIVTANVTFDAAYCESHMGAVPGEYAAMIVKDTGAGMDANTLRHVFEPFFTTKGNCKGTGLGLAMVYGIVKQNKGFINIESEQGAGTSMEVYLPRDVRDVEGT